MPYKIVTTIREQSQDRFFDVIDTKLSRSKKVIKLFMDEDMAEHYARKELKKDENEFKVIEVETAYDYETTGTEPSTTSDDD